MTRTRRLTVGVAREACAHRDRFLVLSPAPIEVYSGAPDPTLIADAAEWCRVCGAIRFGQSGRFVVPEKGRAT